MSFKGRNFCCQLLIALALTMMQGHRNPPQTAFQGNGFEACRLPWQQLLPFCNIFLRESLCHSKTGTSVANFWLHYLSLGCKDIATLLKLLSKAMVLKRADCRDSNYCHFVTSSWEKAYVIQRQELLLPTSDCISSHCDARTLQPSSNCFPRQWFWSVQTAVTATIAIL